MTTRRLGVHAEVLEEEGAEGLVRDGRGGDDAAGGGPLVRENFPCEIRDVHLDRVEMEAVSGLLLFRVREEAGCVW